MSNKKELFLEKYKEYIDFINNVDIEELTEGMTAQEVEEFRLTVNNLSRSNINSKLSQKAKLLLEEENPILKVAHFYPELNNFSFLSKEQIKKLDRHLKLFQVGYPIFNLHRISFQTKLIERIFNELIDNGIAEEKYALVCSHCYEEKLTGYISKEKKNQMIELFNSYKENCNIFSANKFLNDLDSCCCNCTEEFDVDETNTLTWKSNLVLIKEKSEIPRLQ